MFVPRSKKIIIGCILCFSLLLFILFWKSSRFSKQYPQGEIITPTRQTVSGYADQNGTFSCSQAIEVESGYATIPGPGGFQQVVVYHPVHIEEAAKYCHQTAAF